MNKYYLTPAFALLLVLSIMSNDMAGQGSGTQVECDYYPFAFIKHTTVYWSLGLSVDGVPGVPDDIDLILTEDDVIIDNWDYWTPMSPSPVPSSTVLLIEASTQMPDSIFDATIAHLHTLVDSITGPEQLVSIVSYNSVVTEHLDFTNNRTALHNAIDDITRSSGCKLYEAGVLAYNKATETASLCPAIVHVLYSGDDGTSTTDYSAYVKLLHCDYLLEQIFFSIDRIDDTNKGNHRLHGIRFTQNLTEYESTMLDAIEIIRQGKNYSFLRYTPYCMDGTVRRVRLYEKDTSNENKIVTGFLGLPMMPSVSGNVAIAASSIYTSNKDSSVIVPLHLEHNGPPTNGLKNVSFQLSWDSQLLEFHGIVDSSGTLLHSSDIEIISHSYGRIQFNVLPSIQLSGNTVVCYLEFDPVDNDDHDTGFLEIDNFDLSPCLSVHLRPGLIYVGKTPGEFTLPLFLTGDTSICEGSTSLLHAVDGLSQYVWSTGEVGKTITVTTSGEYWYKAVNEGGQTLNSDTVHITVHPLPTPNINPSGPLTLCYRDPLMLETFEEYSSYKWSNGDTSKQILVTEPGEYWVDTETALGCIGRSDTVTVVLSDPPDVTISGPRLACREMETIYRTATPSIQFVEWTVNGGRIIGENNNESVVVVWDAPFGSLRVQGTEGLCTQTDTFTVTTTSIPHELTGESSSCVGIDEVYAVTPASSIDYYRWEIFGGIIQGPDDGPAVTVRWNKGNGLIRSIIGNEICELDDTIFVHTDELDLAIIGDRSPCPDEVYSYLADKTSDVPIVWSIAGGRIVGGDTGDTVRTEWFGDTGRLIAAGVVGKCVTRDTIHVNILPISTPIVTLFGGSTICDGDSVLLRAQEGFSSYLWNTGHTSRTLEVSKSGKYYVVVGNGNGCFSQSDEITITVLPAPEKPQVLQRGDSLYCSIEAAAYQWYFNGNSIPGATQDYHIPLTDGMYSVEVFNVDGCTNISDVVAAVAVEIDELTATDLGFEVYPSPTDGWVTVSVTDHSRSGLLTVTNALGQEIYTQRITPTFSNNSITIDLSTAVPGVYLVSFRTHSRWYSRKLLVQ